MAPRLGMSAAMLALLGCSPDPDSRLPKGDGVTLGGASAVTVVCDQFCDASFVVGCPPDLDGCSRSCESLFRGTCEEKLAAYLDCIPERLSASCLVGHASEGDPCFEIEQDLRWCMSCGGEGGLVGDRGCEGSACGLVTTCDDDGSCTCYQGDELVGTCTAAVAGADACMTHLSCCYALL